MNKKKIIIDLLVITLALLLFVLWYENNFKRKIIVTTSMDEDLIYLITMDKTNQYWTYVDGGASDMAQLLGVDYVWAAPEERNVDEQINVIRDAVNAGADALLLAALDPVRVSEVLQEAKAKGVKIIYVDAPAIEEAVVTLSTDNYTAGVLAGRTMINELEFIGVNSGSIGIVSSNPDIITTAERESGVRDTLTRDGRFQLLDTIYTQLVTGNPQQQVEKMISDSPGIVGLFGTDELSTLYVGNSIDSSNKNIVGIGFDITKEIEVMLRNDLLKAVIEQNPYTMGYLGMAQAYAAIKGFQTGPSYINTGVDIRTQ